MTRILVVDDQIDVLNVQAMILQVLGHEVATAQGGYEALRVCGEFHPEVMLLDIEMPGMNGIEVARQIRDGGCIPTPKVVALTGYQGLKGSLEMSLFDGFLLKPAKLADLQSAISFPSPEYI